MTVLPITCDAQLFINGEFCDAASGKTMDIVNPATGSVIGRLADAGVQMWIAPSMRRKPPSMRERGAGLPIRSVRASSIASPTCSKRTSKISTSSRR
jgi:hypothetical protein